MPDEANPAAVVRDLQARAGGALIDCFVPALIDGEGTTTPVAREAFRDAESLASWPSLAVGYLFGEDASQLDEAKTVAGVVRTLDRWGIARGQVQINPAMSEAVLEEIAVNADRLFAVLRLDPHEGMEAVRAMERIKRRWPFVRSVSVTPHLLYPPIPPSSKEYYPIYAKCVELGLPILINVGMPGPRVPGACQDPAHLDEVCWFFPELKVVMKHGGEPWEEMCVKLMLRWPNLYYATTAFAPKYYPKPILQFANTRGADKLIYAGYWPRLGYDKVFAQLLDLPLRDQVWPKFLRENAERVFDLEPA